MNSNISKELPTLIKNIIFGTKSEEFPLLSKELKDCIKNHNIPYQFIEETFTMVIQASFGEKSEEKSRNFLRNLQKIFEDWEFLGFNAMPYKALLNSIKKSQKEFRSSFESEAFYQEEMKKIVRNSWNIVHVYSLKEFMEAFAQNLDEIPIGKKLEYARSLIEAEKLKESAKVISFFSLTATFPIEERISLAQKMLDKKLPIPDIYPIINDKHDLPLINFLIEKLSKSGKDKPLKSLLKKFELSVDDYPFIIEAFQRKYLKYMLNAEGWARSEEVFFEESAILCYLIEELCKKNLIYEAFSIGKRHNLFEKNEKIRGFFDKESQKEIRAFSNEKRDFCEEKNRDFGGNSNEKGDIWGNSNEKEGIWGNSNEKADNWGNSNEKGDICEENFNEKANNWGNSNEKGDIWGEDSNEKKGDFYEEKHDFCEEKTGDFFEEKLVILKNFIFENDSFDPVEEIYDISKKGFYLNLLEFGLCRKDVLFVNSSQNSEFFIAKNELFHAKYIGIDCEMGIVIKPLQKAKVSIVQLSIEKKIFIFDFDKLENDEEFRIFLREILSQNNYKIGHSLDSDLNQLFPAKTPSFLIPNCIDLTTIFKAIFPFDKQSSLAHISQLILQRPLSKGEQCSNWGKRPLREAQMHYSALDSFICLKLYEKMLKKCEEVIKNVIKSMKLKAFLGFLR